MQRVLYFASTSKPLPPGLNQQASSPRPQRASLFPQDKTHANMLTARDGDQGSLIPNPGQRARLVDVRAADVLRGQAGADRGRQAVARALRHVVAAALAAAVARPTTRCHNGMACPAASQTPAT